MTLISAKALGMTGVAILVLAACEEGQMGAQNTGQSTVLPPPEPRIEIQDVQRADIFSSTELALWDGRPSLGGVWVAHPDVTDPERALIRNMQNGQTITGALFRRERENPGPRIQVSSDAASALQMLAGQPTELSVIVLRREEVVIEPVLPPVEDVVAEEEVPVEVTEEPAPEPVAAVEASDSDTSAVETTVGTAAAVAPQPRRPGFFEALGRAFGGGNSGQPLDATGGAVASDAAPAANVETTTLDPIEAAAAAIEEAEATEAAAVVAPAAPPPAPAPAPAGLRNPFVQVGLFTVEANAEAAAASLRQGGIVPTVVPGSNDTRNFWRVLVGPMSNATEQAEMLGQVRALGYADAFLTPN